MRVLIRMQSTESAHYYMETKNKSQEIEKRKNKKFDPVLQRHVLYTEQKVRK